MASTATRVRDVSVAEWVSRARAGNESAFRWMVDTYSVQMAQVCFAVCGDAEMAEEAVAAAWPVAWQKLDTLRDVEQLNSWLVSIAANRARDLARSRRRRAVREVAVFDAGQPSTAPFRSDEQIDLANALSRLRPEDRALLALRYVCGFDSNELARATGLSPSGTRARLARLLERMRRELSDV